MSRKRQDTDDSVFSCKRVKREFLAVNGCGSNFGGQLGEDAQLELTRPTRIELDDSIVVAMVAAGAMHSLFQLEDGRLLTMGSNDDGALGRDAKDEPLGFVDRFGSFGVVCRQIACGDSHSAVLDTEGRVWTWGTYHDPVLGRIGYNDDLELSLEPRLVNAGGLGTFHVQRIAAGENHLLALVSPGLVYEWGAPLSHAPSFFTQTKEQQIVEAKEFLAPRIAPILSAGLPPQQMRVRSMWATGKQSFVQLCDENNTLLGWGLNNYAQIDAGQHPHVPTAIRVGGLEKFAQPMMVKDMAGGDHHVLALINEKVFSWGRTHYGRLGRTIEDKKAETSPPAQVVIPQEVRALYAGAAHSFALTQAGDVYAWGFNSSGQLGLGPLDDDEISAPTLINGLSCLQLATNANHSLFLRY